MKSNIPPDRIPDELIEQWACIHYPIGLNSLMGSGLTEHDSENVIGHYFERPSSRSADGRVEIVPTGVFLHRLKQTLANLIEKETADKRGGGVAHISAESLEGWGLSSRRKTWSFTDCKMKLKLRERDLKSVESLCNNSAQKLLLQKMIAANSECCCDKGSLRGFFTADEALHFLQNRGRETEFDLEKFRKKINQVRRQIERMIEKKHGRSGDFYLN